MCVCVCVCVCGTSEHTRTHTHARAFSLSFFHRSRYTGKTGFGRRAPLLGLGRKSRRTHCFKGIVPEVAAHVSVLLGLHIISDGLTSFQTDSNTHQQVSGQGSCCPCCAIGPLTSSPAASRASSAVAPAWSHSGLIVVPLLGNYYLDRINRGPVLLHVAA